MRRITLVALVAMTISWGLPVAQAAETVSGADTIESLPSDTTTSRSSSITSPSQRPLPHVGSLPQSAAPDCDGQAPSTGTVTALRSRLDRSSTLAHGVQCPIPPVPDHLTRQELHP